MDINAHQADSFEHKPDILLQDKVDSIPTEHTHESIMLTLPCGGSVLGEVFATPACRHFIPAFLHDMLKWQQIGTIQNSCGQRSSPEVGNKPSSFLPRRGGRHSASLGHKALSLKYPFYCLHKLDISSKPASKQNKRFLTTS